MRLPPSKELMSAVLGRSVKGDGRIYANDSDITFAYDDEDMWSDLNIYEFMHLCKEWLKNKNYMVSAYYHMDTVAITMHINGSRVYSTNSMQVDTETEAIFKACEWVLENEI